MRFFTTVATFGLAAFALAQESSSATSTSAAASGTAALSPEQRCIADCGETDICCKAACVNVPCPNGTSASLKSPIVEQDYVLDIESLVFRWRPHAQHVYLEQLLICTTEQAINQTTECAGKCIQGNGTEEETASYAACQQSCISASFFPIATNVPGNTASGSGAEATTTGETASGMGESIPIAAPSNTTLTHVQAGLRPLPPDPALSLRAALAAAVPVRPRARPEAAERTSRWQCLVLAFSV